MNRKVWLRPLILAAAVCSISASTALSQWSINTISDPLPDDLKERTAALLRVVRANDFEAALAGVKVMDGDGWRKNDVLFMRIEADCRAQWCMTMVLRVTDRELIPELTLQAGKHITFTDVGGHLWQSRETWLPILFHSGRGTVVQAIRRDGIWVVSAGSCEWCFRDDMPDPPRARPRAPPSPPEPPETFEDFQRRLREVR